MTDSGTYIRILSPQVANAIAAGEVIERPASVVKELVENALDAGARGVTVEVRGAGRTLIRVTDDGGGIGADQIGLAFHRHATSKVATIADLESIGTLGFRGEALASIAAVAEVECWSSGRSIRLRAGEVLAEGPAPPASGTRLEVRDLFANTPARLKFLKSPATEQGTIARTVAWYALVNPGVRFKLLLDGRTNFVTTGSGDLRQVMAAIHGQTVSREMTPLDWREERLTIEGMVSPPRLSRGSRESVLFAVNGRPVASRSLSFALEECYRGRLEKGRYPVAVLGLRVPPETVDVNVHPAKREIRFKEEGRLFAALQRAVRGALSDSAPHSLSIGRPSMPTSPPPFHPPTPAPAVQPRLGVQSTDAPALEVAIAILRPVGQVGDGYLLAEGESGLLLIDQHAAHERVLFNRFRARLEGAPILSQPLLLPVLLEVGPAVRGVASERGGELRRLGFDWDDFGPSTIRLTAAPAETPAGRAGEALAELLDIMADGRSADRLHDVAASLACHSAVRFGDRMDPAEQRQLVNQLEAEPESVTCPHGRPTRLVLSWEELRRHFRRNY